MNGIQKFGKLDSNIGGGMDPAYVAKKSIEAIYFKDYEIYIASKWPKITVFLSRISSIFSSNFANYNHKIQLNAIKNAK